MGIAVWTEYLRYGGKIWVASFAWVFTEGHVMRLYIALIQDPSSV